MNRFLEITLGNAGSAVLLAILAALVARFFTRRPAVVHAMWVLVLIRLLVPPVLELGLMPPAPGITVTGSVLSAIPVANTSTLEKLSTASALAQPQNLALIGWAMGTIFLLGLIFIRSRRLRGLLASGSAPDPGLSQRVTKLARTMGLTRAPTVRLIGHGAPPMLWGPVGSPSLILPAPLLVDLEEDEQEALIAHELAHLKRRDHWVRYLEVFSSIAFWWHPVLWWARRRLRTVEELCCDAMVARRLPNHRRAYAQCLVKTLGYLSDRRPTTIAGSAMASFSDIKGRITMIMSSPHQNRLPSFARALLAVVALTVLVLSPTLAARGSADTDHFIGDPISLNLEQASLKDLLSSFSQITGRTFALHPTAEEAGLLDAKITIGFTDVPWDQALSTILDINGLGWTREGDVIWIHPKWTTPPAAPGEMGERTFTGKPISLTLNNADLRDVLSTFAELAHLEILVDSAVDASVTVDIDGLPWDQALDMIIQISGLEYSRNGQTIIVRPRSKTIGEILSPKASSSPAFSTQEISKEDAAREVLNYLIPGDDMSPPQRLDGPPPKYPEEARKAGVSGVVVLDTVIGADGTVISAVALREMPYGLTEAAIDAVKQWRFEPSRRQGEPVAVKYILTVNFRLDNKEKG